MQCKKIKEYNQIRTQHALLIHLRTIVDRIFKKKILSQDRESDKLLVFNKFKNKKKKFIKSYRK